MAKQRVDKILTAMGLCSRKEASLLAKSGAVTVDGAVCRDASVKIDPQVQRLALRGVPVTYEEYVYLMLNKPLGVLSATEDREQQTVLDLLPARFAAMGVFPVGRLDKETAGLLLLTNDGEFAHQLTSPKHRVDKVYEAQTDGTPGETAVRAFAEGVVLRDGTHCLPARLEVLRPGFVRVTVQEGKYHQVRRMLAACGTPVTALRRIAEGALTLDPALSEGQWRTLKEEEISSFSKN